jgi:hypothetical protein
VAPYFLSSGIRIKRGMVIAAKTGVADPDHFDAVQDPASEKTGSGSDNEKTRSGSCFM